MADPFGRDTCNSESCVSMSDLCEIKFGNLDPMLNYVISTTRTGAVEFLPTEESAFEITNNGNGTGTISTAGGDVDFVTAPVDFCEKFNECFTAPINGPLNAATNWQTAANITSDCLADVKGRLETLEALPVDNVEGVVNPDGSTTITIDGVAYGDFVSGPHTVDTDTFVTITNNGDGTATVSNADGTTQTIDIVDTDTFATVVNNGDGTSTTTYADGTVITNAIGPHTVDTDTFSTVVDNGDGTFTTTYADGTVITSASGPHTPSSTLTRQADGSFDHVAGGVTRSIPVDLTETDLNDAAIPNTQHGLSAGQLALAYDSGGVSGAAVALWDSSKALAYSVAPRSIISALYNSADDGVLGVTGIRNTDGSFGHYSRFVSDPILAVDENNGAFTSIAFNTLRFGETFEIPNGRYDGQVLKINIEGSAFQGILTGNFSGVLRDPLAGRIAQRTFIASIGVRIAEQLTMVWNGTRWFVTQTFHMLGGTGWRELEDGTIDMWGSTPGGAVAPAPETHNVVFPVTLAVPAVPVTLGFLFGGTNTTFTGTPYGRNLSVTGFDIQRTQDAPAGSIIWRVNAFLDYTTI